MNAFGSENECVQGACGENHSVFLTKNKLVFTAGSNEFGQLGITKNKVIDDEDVEMDNDQVESKPMLIEKDRLDNVDYIAAGKYHTVIIRRKNMCDNGLGQMDNGDD